VALWLTRLAHKVLDPAGHRAGSHGSRLTTERRAEAVEPDDIDTVAERFVEIATTAHPRAQVGEGAAPVSESSGRQLVVLEVESYGSGTISDAQVAYRATHKSKGVATANQRLLVASDRLQLVDLQALDRYASTVLALPEKAPKNRERRAVCAALAASLLFGQEIDHLGEIAVIDDPESLGVKGTHPTLLRGTQVAWIPILPCAKQFEPDVEEAPYYRPTVEWLLVEFPSSLNLFRLLVTVLRGSKSRFPFKSQALHEQARKTISIINGDLNVRLTAARIAGFLERQVIAITGDRADAAILARKGDADARRYYYAPRTRHLQCVF